MLTKFQTQSRDLQLLQSSWAADLDPLLANPISSGILLNGINLINGNTTINHLLGRKMQGFYLTDINGAALIYRSMPFNDKTLTLNSNAIVTVNIYAF